MKIEEVKQILNLTEKDENISPLILCRILDIPLDDCTPSELNKIANKLHHIAEKEDNGEILITMGKTSISHALTEHPDLNYIIQVLISYGFTLGYLLSNMEKYQEIKL